MLCGGLIQEIFSILFCSFPLFSSGFSAVFISLALGIRLTSIYMLRCWGDTTSWDFFAYLPVHSFSLSWSLLLSTFFPLCPLSVWAYIIEWVAYFYMLQITRVYRLPSDVWIEVKLIHNSLFLTHPELKIGSCIRVLTLSRESSCFAKLSTHTHTFLQWSLIKSSKFCTWFWRKTSLI